MVFFEAECLDSYSYFVLNVCFDLKIPTGHYVCIYMSILYMYMYMYILKPKSSLPSKHIPPVVSDVHFSAYVLITLFSFIDTNYTVLSSM